MSHSMLKRLVKSNVIDRCVEVVNCQNQCPVILSLLLTFSLNDDVIFHYVRLRLGGLVPGGCARYEHILFS